MRPKCGRHKYANNGQRHSRTRVRSVCERNYSRMALPAIHEFCLNPKTHLTSRWTSAPAQFSRHYRPETQPIIVRFINAVSLPRRGPTSRSYGSPHARWAAVWPRNARAGRCLYAKFSPLPQPISKARSPGRRASFSTARRRMGKMKYPVPPNCLKCLSKMV